MKDEMNGAEQVRAYASLYQPDQLSGFKVGSLADVPSLGRVEVIELMPPALLKVRTSTGTIAKVGYRVCRRA